MDAQFRRGAAQEWVDYNPVLSVGEPGFETDTRLLKIGDGITQWVDLPYIVLDDNVFVSRTTIILSSTPPSPSTPGTVWIQRDAVPTGGGVAPAPPPVLNFLGVINLSDSGVLAINGSMGAQVLVPSDTLAPSNSLLPNG